MGKERARKKEVLAQRRRLAARGSELSFLKRTTGSRLSARPLGTGGWGGKRMPFADYKINEPLLMRRNRVIERPVLQRESEVYLLANAFLQHRPKLATPERIALG